MHVFLDAFLFFFVCVCVFTDTHMSTWIDRLLDE